MTTYTISCAPTFAPTTSSQTDTQKTDYTIVEEGGDREFKGVDASFGTVVSATHSEDSTVVVATNENYGSQTERLADPNGLGLVFETLTSSSYRETLSYVYSTNGAYTFAKSYQGETNGVGDAGDDATTAETQTITTERQSTSLATESYQKRQTYTTTQSVVVGTINTNSEATTATASAEKTNSQLAQFTRDKIVTTTNEQTITSYIDGTRVYGSATVVLLEENETGFVVTARPNFTVPTGAALQPFGATQFTVFPSIATAGGFLEEGTSYIASDTEFNSTFVDFSYTTQSSLVEQSTIYKTTKTSHTTVTAGSSITAGATAFQIPPYTRTFQTTTLVTDTTGYTNSISLFTGGNTSETTVWDRTTHSDRLSDTTWTETHNAVLVVTSSFPLFSLTSSSTQETITQGGAWSFFTETATSTYTELSGPPGSESTETLTSTFTIDTYSNDFPEGGDGTSEVVESYAANSINFRRAVTIGAATAHLTQAQNQRAMSVFNGFAAPFSLGEPALLVGAGITVQGATSSIVAARTARLPLPVPATETWSYTQDASTVTVSVNGAGLTASSVYGPSSALSTSTQSGEWTTEGEAIFTGSVPFFHRRNMGGRPATGDAVTALQLPGLWATSRGTSSGTTFQSEAQTTELGTSDERTAYGPRAVAISGNNRYITMQRNPTEVVDSSQLLL